MKSLLFALLTSVAIVPLLHAQTPLTSETHPFLPLPYAYEALEPYIDAQTMQIHYDRHYRAYHQNFLKAIAGTEWEHVPAEKLMGQISGLSPAIRNNGGGYYNHLFFWNTLAPQPGTPSEPLLAAIQQQFGSMEALQTEFATKAKSVFGSGWAWLIVTPQGQLQVVTTPNQDNPLMDVAPVKGTPILGIDVWEHAYYLKYQNKRPDYIDAFWKIVHWSQVSSRYAAALK